MTVPPIVSFDDESLILVNDADDEICHVYAGPLIGRPAVNPEVAATTMMAASALDRELADRPELYTPWLKLEWARVRDTWPASSLP